MSLVIEETQDITPCVALRMTVFVQEQGISAEDEVDALDASAIHLLAVQDGVPVGTARLLLSDDGYGKIGRVCVLAQARGMGVGAALIRAGIARLRQVEGLKAVKLGAQDHAIGFYEGLGFEAYGPFYDDAGIPHRDMKLVL